MPDVFVGTTSDFEEHNRRIVNAAGREIVVIRARNAFRAFTNMCLHMGGPVGEGVIMPKVEAVLDDQQRLMGETFSADKLHLVCPWHGWEYDIDTGRAIGNSTLQLERYETAVRGDDVYVVLPDA